MARTLLQLVTAACQELGLPAPSPQLVGNLDPGALQILALAQREGKEFVDEANPLGGWPQLRKDFTFNLTPAPAIASITASGTTATLTTQAAHGLSSGQTIITTGQVPNAYQAQAKVTVTSSTVFTYPTQNAPSGPATALGTYYNAYALPSDLQFWLPQTGWDANFRWQMLGPLDEQEWKVLQYGISPVGPRLRYILKNNLIIINPAPGTTQTDLIALSYISNQWCTKSDGTGQTAWAADTDTYVLDEECFIMGMKWRILRAKGLSYQQEKKDFDRRKDRQKARAGGSRTLPLNAIGGGVRLLNAANVPDTGFGS